VSIRFGEPFLIDLDDVRENYQKAADIMMEKIKELKEDEN
jgi:1-acyl-sn-glycerol-3-phosphate acyltransferase